MWRGTATLLPCCLPMDQSFTRPLSPVKHLHVTKCSPLVRSFSSTLPANIDLTLCRPGQDPLEPCRSLRANGVIASCKKVPPIPLFVSVVSLPASPLRPKQTCFSYHYFSFSHQHWHSISVFLKLILRLHFHHFHRLTHRAMATKSSHFSKRLDGPQSGSLFLM